MKKPKNIINLGEDFKENKNIFTQHTQTLDECYVRPSDRKKYIYNYYYKLLLSNSDELLDYGITSYNCNIIILGATIKKDNRFYLLKITPSYNYFKEV